MPTLQTSYAARRFASILLLLTLAACASQVVKDEHLSQRTAFALSVEQSDITISGRSDDGLKTSYSARTRDGRQFNCYVEGSFSFGTGSVVTDAICNPAAGSSKAASKGSSCNALLKGAHKC